MRWVNTGRETITGCARWTRQRIPVNNGTHDVWPFGLPAIRAYRRAVLLNWIPSLFSPWIHIPAYLLQCRQSPAPFCAGMSHSSLPMFSFTRSPNRDMHTRGQRGRNQRIAAGINMSALIHVRDLIFPLNTGLRTSSFFGQTFSSSKSLTIVSSVTNDSVFKPS